MMIRKYLLVRSSGPENVYGRFALEILSAEGLNGFDCVDLDGEALGDFGVGDLVVLTRCFLRDAQIERLCAGVERGASVVCFQPSPRLAARLGWVAQKQVVHPGWVKIGQGYPGSGPPIQTHCPVALHQPAESLGRWQCLAEAVRPDWSDAEAPAVAGMNLGHGRIVLFFYDLPKAVARIRFGNPDLASHVTTGIWQSLHAADMFVGHLDRRVRHLPQADFHGQLLAKILTDLSPYPLPRFWYYPQAAHRTAAILQSDGDLSTPEQFRELSEAVLARRGSASFFLMRQTKLTERDVAELRACGHTFAPHVNPLECGDEWCFNFPPAVRAETEAFERRFGDVSRSIQCHYAPWQGYMSWAPVFVDNGYRLLFAYLSLPADMLNRYMCGSGRPMRFFDCDGRRYDCWQQPVIAYDDASIRQGLQDDPSRAIGEFEAMARDALDRTHTAVAILSHPVNFSDFSRPYIEACLDFLCDNGAPIYNGDQWCDFLYRRDAARADLQAGAPGSFRCVVTNLQGQAALMLPLPDGLDAPRRVAVDGVEVAPCVHRRLEQDYLWVQLDGKGEPVSVEMNVD